jgi:O-antigen ligase
MLALLQPSSCFRFPPRAFWYFVGYVYILVLMIFWHGFEAQQPAIGPLRTLIQLLGLFWISYNLMQYEHIRTRTLEVLALSCTLLAAMLVFSIVSVASEDAFSMNSPAAGVVSEQRGRVTAFGANPNAIAGLLALGLLSVVGLVFGQQKKDIKVRLLAWPCLGVFAIAIVRTGSRGAVVAVMAGLLMFLLKGKGISPTLKSWVKKARLKIGLAAVVVVGLVILLSYHYDPVRVRWERTLTEGHTSGRDKINAASFGMFLEKPWLGWGPGAFYFELGSRLGIPARQPHNLYFWLVLETGLVGAVPFVAGLWLCWQAAWRARGGIHSVLAAGLLAAILTTSLKSANHKSKLFWIVLAYALASGSVAALPRMRKAANSSGQMVARVVRNRARTRPVAPLVRPFYKSPPN